MRPNALRHLPVLAVLWLIAADESLAQPGMEHASEAVPSTLLNSERIEQRFGSYGVEVLKSDQVLRVSNLFSEQQSGRICRTFAVVRYPEVIDPLFAAEHALIVNGGSIGAVFTARGWTVERQHRHFGEVASTAKLRRMMGDIPSSPLAIHIFDLVVSRGAASFVYATIAEVHHPGYLSLGDLLRIFGGVNEAPQRDTTRMMLEATLREMD